MGLTNYIFSIDTRRVDDLLGAVEAGLAVGSVEPINTHIQSLGMADWVADEIGAIEIVTTKTLLRRTESRVLRPGAGIVIEAMLQRMGSDLPPDKVCNPDKAFQMLQTAGLRVKLDGIDGIGDWLDVVRCKVNSPAKHLRTGDAPDYVLVPQDSRNRLADTTAVIRLRYEGNDSYVTEPLRQFEALLRGSEDETIVSIVT
jgi:hypothetical protein